MHRLRELLATCDERRIPIFDEDTFHDREVHRESSGKSSSPFRRSVNSLQPGGRRSRSPSPAFGIKVSASDLLSRCISILSSVVTEDCRFKMSLPRPFRPPYSLHAKTLEVAELLLKLQAHKPEPRFIQQLAYALIPAFSSFPSETYARLLAFFENCIVRGALQQLRANQDAENVLRPASERGITSSDDLIGPEQPVVAITVDEVYDSDTGTVGRQDFKWKAWSHPVGSQAPALRSTNASSQSSSVYRLASIVPPLLAAVMENVDIGSARPEALHRMHRLLNTIVDLKFDAYLDVLEVMAYHTPKARHSAATLLRTHWPKAVGHVVISKSTTSPGSVREDGTQNPYSHQFVPWHFALDGTGESSQCQACTKPVAGFGLLCPFCMCGVHLDCYDYPEGNSVINYSPSSNPDTSRVAIRRFSHILDPRTEGNVVFGRKRGHNFRYVNIFTLCVCLACRKPLWGCQMQGLRCTKCLQFFHHSCALDASERCGAIAIDSGCTAIEWTTLRDSYAHAYPELVEFTRKDVENSSYEDISVLYSFLWTQLQIILSGIAFGSIVVTKNGKNATDTKAIVASFELHRLLSWCENTLTSKDFELSGGMLFFFRETHVQKSPHSMMFEWTNLIHMLSCTKNPQDGQNLTSNTLTISRFEADVDFPSASDPFEVIPLSHIRNILGHEFRVQSDICAKLLLSHMHHLGLFNRVDMNPSLFDANGNASTYCNFALPTGLDVSQDVETLFSSVEACLSDIDLSVNETGFLLLNRRLWPSGIVSEYALNRLSRAIVSWILAEDDNLATILRDYLAKRQALPGVRSNAEAAPWPSFQSTRHAPSSTVNSGGDYVESRRALLRRYAVPWLHALHNQDIDAYAALVYEICADFADDSIQHSTDVSFVEEQRKEEYPDQLLRLISRLFNYSVTFSATEIIFGRWLDSVLSSGIVLKPISSLARVFQNDGDGSHRFSTADVIPDNSLDVPNLDPLSYITKISSTSEDGLTQSLRWLLVFTSSGVEISVTTFVQFSQKLDEGKASLSASHLFLKALLRSVWFRAGSRDQLQKVVAGLHRRLYSKILEILKGTGADFDVLCFIRQSLAACLLLYGCDRQKLLQQQMIKDSEINDLPSRRKMVARASEFPDPIVVDPLLMEALETYMTAHNDDVSCLIGKFLYIFLMDSPYLEPYEVDNFILRNATMLCRCAFQLYDTQRHELSSLRTGFLLRVLVVDAQPLRELLHDWFQPSGSWEIRLIALARLFRIILDITDPTFTIEDLQWRVNICDIFYYYFKTLWSDEKEELRLAAETFSSNLLPAHFHQISSCWGELLLKSPITDRIRLISFLVQLRPHFPLWQVISWDVILEILKEDQYAQEGDPDGPLGTHLAMYGLSSQEKRQNDVSDADMAQLRVSVLVLSLEMIAGGFRPINYNDLARIKVHLAQVIGFEGVRTVMDENGFTLRVVLGEVKQVSILSFPCIQQLLVLFDSPDPLIVDDGYLQADSLSPFLVGSPFIDILLGLFESPDDLAALPILVLKSMLESLGVAILKHNFEDIHIRLQQPALKRAVSRAMELMLQDINYECRQIALSTLQAYIKKWHGSLPRSFIHFAIEQAAKLILSQSHSGNDPLVSEAKDFIENTLSIYSTNGVFVGLMRRQIDRSLFVVLKQILDANARENPSDPLRDTLLRDTLPRSVDVDQGSFQMTLDNLQLFVELVHHQNYSQELMTFVGQQLTSLVRRTSEMGPNSVNPAPLLLIPAMLIQHNKAHCRDLLISTDTVLRACLNRLAVDSASLSKLVQVTATLYRRSQPLDKIAPTNIVIQIMFEILADGLRMKTRTLPVTLKALLETIMTADMSGSTPAMSHADLFVGLVHSGLHFLHHHSWVDLRSDVDFSVSLGVSKMILLSNELDATVMSKVAKYGIEKSGRQNTNVRAWNVLVLAVLLDPSESWIASVFHQLDTFSVVYHTALRGLVMADSAITDINHAYIAIKLWMMLAQKKASREGAENLDALTVWNELWPPFESIVTFIQQELHEGTLFLLTASTLADLFIFLRQSRSPITLHLSSQIATLNHLRTLGKGEAHTGKLARAIRILSESPTEVPLEILVNQVAKDIIATEKLRVLDMSKDFGKPSQDKRGGRSHHTTEIR
ncbi:hypothetical protein K435DRAFT_727522 [Dendrothele bispora CBS 962.96]|uniref:Phorbol-ester/DAG-type domain-containing protein n=1 Tax=Dendrothele bispora (strain CBS 962.96) TaxID=1314807 RepID=A0A4S8LQK4_DENBC|nr:hypothetical protein K435DRAFT_727522 [Dendrothele bispora CBS 962.96]